MLDRFFDLLQAIFSHLIPFVKLEPFESGVHTRLGKYKRDLGPGFWWVIPFGVDAVWHEHITPRTEHLVGLATTTVDGRAIGFDAVVTWKIHNIRKALMEVTELKDAIADICAGQIGTTLAESDWPSIREGKTVEKLTDVCRARGWKWGVEIIQVQLSGIAVVKTIRITSNSQPHAVHLTPNPSL